MVLASLFNKKCSWRRKSATQEDEFGEFIYTETIISSDVPCAFQEITRDLKENIPQNINVRIFDLFLAPDEDIRVEDIYIFEGSDNYLVKDVADAAGRDHHLEVLVEQNKIP